MPEIHIERRHSLGLVRARALALRWADQAERDHGLRCRYEPGSAAAAGGGEVVDVLHFSTAGAVGTVEVRARRFDVSVELGFLLAGFGAVVAQKVSRQFDELLAQEKTRRG